MPRGLPTLAATHVGSYLGYTGRAANAVRKAALDPPADIGGRIRRAGPRFGVGVTTQANFATQTPYLQDGQRRRVPKQASSRQI